MSEYTYITLRERPELNEAAAEWFNKSWGVPKEAYLECMEDYLSGRTETVRPNMAGISVWMETGSLPAWA